MESLQVTQARVSHYLRPSQRLSKVLHFATTAGLKLDIPWAVYAPATNKQKAAEVITLITFMDVNQRVGSGVLRHQGELLSSRATRVWYANKYGLAIAWQDERLMVNASLFSRLAGLVDDVTPQFHHRFTIKEF